MGSTDIFKATIWEDGDATEMARMQLNGANITQSVITSITRKIYEVSNDNAEIDSGTALDKTSVVFDTLQTDGRWTKDEFGYNFRDRIAGTFFATGGAIYRVEYAFVGSNDEAFKLVFEHDANALIGS